MATTRIRKLTILIGGIMNNKTQGLLIRLIDSATLAELSLIEQEAITPLITSGFVKRYDDDIVMTTDDGIYAIFTDIEGVITVTEHKDCIDVMWGQITARMTANGVKLRYQHGARQYQTTVPFRYENVVFIKLVKLICKNGGI
jgi:hypothetical protein